MTKEHEVITVYKNLSAILGDKENITNHDDGSLQEYALWSSINNCYCKIVATIGSRRIKGIPVIQLPIQEEQVNPYREICDKLINPLDALSFSVESPLIEEMKVALHEFREIGYTATSKKWSDDDLKHIKAASHNALQYYNQIQLQGLPSKEDVLSMLDSLHSQIERGLSLQNKSLPKSVVLGYKVGMNETSGESKYKLQKENGDVCYVELNYELIIHEQDNEGGIIIPVEVKY